MNDILIPRPLHAGSRIAIISPASIVREEYIDGAVEFLRGKGYCPEVMPHAKGPADGCYAASAGDRLADFLRAWTDPGIDAVLCSRGGYGTAHLLPHLPADLLRDNAKWLVGFSDISALHAALLGAGVASIHGPMAKHLCENPDSEATHALMNLLAGARMDYEVPTHSLSRPGRAEGRLAGGNLAVLNGLAATPCDLFARAAAEDVILFVEDVSEAIYAVERMLWRLYMAGTLHRVKGLIFGQFTDYRSSVRFGTMEEMLDSLLVRIGLSDIPVAFGFPTGHVDHNLPLVEGATVCLETGDATRLTQK